LNDEAENSTYDYASSDDNFFSDATINNNDLNGIDELVVESSGSYLALEASIEASKLYIWSHFWKIVLNKAR